MRTFIKKLWDDDNARRWGAVAGVVYFVVYQISLGHLRIMGSGGFSLTLAKNWQQLFFKTSAPFLWEPLLRWTTPLFEWVIAPVNIFLGLVLGALVIVNVGATIYLYSLPKMCRLDAGTKGLWGILPSFLTGFACCAPTFLIPLVSVFGSLTIYITWLRILLIPAGLLLLVWGAYYSRRQIRAAEARLPA